MSTLKLLLYLNSRYPSRVLPTCYLLNYISLTSKHVQFFSVCGSLQGRKAQQKHATAVAGKAISDDLDFFGVEHYTGIRKEEHAREKEAWLQSQNLAMSQSEETASQESEKQSTKMESFEEAEHYHSVGEAEHYHSDLVEQLIISCSPQKKKTENAVKHDFGWVRYDIKKPPEMDVRSNKVEYTERRSNRFSNIAGESLRKSLRGKRNEMLKITNRSEFSSLSDIGPTDNDGIISDREFGSSFIEDQYFQYDVKPKHMDTQSQTKVPDTQIDVMANEFPKKEKSHTKSHLLHEKIVTDSRENSDEDNESNLSYIDKQYFMTQADTKPKFRKKTLSSVESNFDTPTKSFGSDFIDDQYFHYNLGKDHDQKFSTPVASKTDKKKKLMSLQSAENVTKSKINNAFVDQSKAQHEGSDYIDEQYFSTNSYANKSRATKSTAEESVPTIVNNRRMQTEKEAKTISLNETSKKKDDQKAETAREVAMQIRKELNTTKGIRLYGKMNVKEVDSKGFFILKEQVPDFTNVPASDIADLLRKNIIYNHNDIVAINKPYGLCSQSGPGVRVNVEQLSCEILPSVDLHLITKLDKETTGVMLLAKTAQMARALHDSLRQGEAVRKYLVVTKNAPKLLRGEINIPIADGEVAGKVRKTLKPYGNSEMQIPARLSKNAERAVTRYNVLDKQDQCAILECVPLTSVKHQIRVHLAFGLNCPILGDHKYSHFDKIAPMKLPPTMLDRLRIRQSKVRHVAMHMHARSVVIPEFLDGQNLVVSAPLPSHFVKNIKKLKLKMPPRK